MFLKDIKFTSLKFNQDNEPSNQITKTVWSEKNQPPIVILPVCTNNKCA